VRKLLPESGAALDVGEQEDQRSRRRLRLHRTRPSRSPASPSPAKSLTSTSGSVTTARRPTGLFAREGTDVQTMLARGTWSTAARTLAALSGSARS
jgi:hypothetical protein